MFIVSSSKFGKEALEKKDSVLIGLSIRNRYFNESKLKELISWTCTTFKHITIMCPDKPAVYTLRSLGYSELEAAQKARLACNNLENKCRRIIRDLGTDKQPSIIRWGSLLENVQYLQMHKELKALYAKDPQFRRDIRTTTKAVIIHNGTTLSLEVAIDIGVEFLFMELALITDATEILGVRKNAYLYHQEMPVLTNFFDGRYDLSPASGNGYIIADTYPPPGE